MKIYLYIIYHHEIEKNDYFASDISKITRPQNARGSRHVAVCPPSYAGPGYNYNYYYYHLFESV